MEVEDFTPETIARRSGAAFVTLLVELRTCANCAIPIIPKHIIAARGVFPDGQQACIKSQMERGGIGVRTAKNEHERWLCDKCAPENSRFRCFLCKELRIREEAQREFGDPPEYLCKTCYATVPAQAWEEAEDELNEAHRYDWE